MVDKNLVYAGLAGIAAAFILSKANVNSIKTAANQSINMMAQSHPLAAPAIATALGQVPTYSRAFPDRSFLFNSLPSPMVEHLVPFDVAGRYANITGAYDRCDAVTFP